MIKHIILWKLKEQYNKEEKEKIAAGIKEGLTSLVGKIPGLLDVNVYTDGLESSTADVMLDSTFQSEADLEAYKVHPAHVAVADNRVRPFVSVRLCLDYKTKKYHDKIIKSSQYS